MADKVLRLDASQADWLAFAAAQWAIQDAGEEFAAGYKNTSEMIEIDVAVEKLGDAAAMIREVRQDRCTVHLSCARAIAVTASDNTTRYLGNRHIQVLRAKGHDQADAERQRDQQANEALTGISIIEAIDALEREESGATKGDASLSITPTQEVTLAEIVVKRDAIDRMWARYETLDSDEEGSRSEKDEAYRQADLASTELYELTFRAIAEGTVPGRPAAEAVVGARALKVDAVEQAMAFDDAGTSPEVEAALGAAKKSVAAMYALADQVEADSRLPDKHRSRIATEINDLATTLDENTFRPRVGAATSEAVGR